MRPSLTPLHPVVASTGCTSAASQAPRQHFSLPEEARNAARWLISDQEECPNLLIQHESEGII